jgi:CheY-like chemotaxis protein
VLERLKRNAALAATPVIVLTASADEAVRAHALQSGEQSFLTKPVGAEVLVGELRRVLAGPAAG